MVAAHQPFMKPVPDDVHYKTIFSNRADFFWKMHCQTKDEGKDFFSKEIKDLITNLLQYDPARRPSISEITKHPWYNGELPTHEEMYEEFQKRKEMLEQDNMDVDGDAEDFDVDPDVFHQQNAHRGIEDGSTGASIGTRKVQEYIPRAGKNTQFFSTSDLQMLFRNLGGYVHGAATDYTFSADDYSVKMRIVDSDNISVSLSIRILKVEGEDKYCVQAIKHEGNRFVFSEIYKQIKEFFAGHANAKPPTASE